MGITINDGDLLVGGKYPLCSTELELLELMLNHDYVLTFQKVCLMNQLYDHLAQTDGDLDSYRMSGREVWKA